MIIMIDIEDGPELKTWPLSKAIKKKYNIKDIDEIN